jgi:hypothetical protein
MPPHDSENGAMQRAPSTAKEAVLASGRPLAELEHPWLGLESFREETSAFFFGREAEITELLVRLRSQPPLVLYGRSGLGKTSVLTASLIPRLRAEGGHPLLLRLRYGEGEAEPCAQIAPAVFASANGQIGRAVRHVSHEAEAERWTQQLGRRIGIILPDDYPSRLWLRLHHRREPPGITNLVLDQFEEVFALGGQVPGAENSVRDALVILLQGAIPEAINRVIAEHDTFLDDFDPDSVPVRVIIALRDDYVYGLNRWQRHLPALGQNNFELRALRGPAAFDAVFKPGELRCHYRGQVNEESKAETGLPPIITRETARRIVRFIAKRGEEVPIEEIEAVPPILSLLCHELNERRFAYPAGTPEAPAAQITFREVDGYIEKTIATFYERCVAGRPEAVRIFIEEEMVSYSGVRLAQDEQSILRVFEKGCKVPGAAYERWAAGFGDAEAARACLQELVCQRLLSLSGGNQPAYELINDLLASVAEQSRTARQERFEKEEAARLVEAERKAKELAEMEALLTRRRARKVAITIGATLAVALIAAVISFMQYGRAMAAKREAEKATKQAITALEEVEKAKSAAEEAAKHATVALEQLKKTKSAADELINFLQYDLRDTVEKTGRRDIMSAIDDRIRKFHSEAPAETGDLDTSPGKASP